ncbi:MULTISPECIES: class I SAM-dependent methyltransferase [Kitasatospora]
MTSHGGTGSEDRPVDQAARSVAVYTDHADDYRAAHAAKMSDRAERFAGSLPVPSLILDAGCGPGRDLARFIAHGHVARGADLNPVFVAMASAHAPTTVGDLRDIGSRYPDGTFDGIWASASLVHLLAAEAVDVLGQFARLLRPGGRLYVCLKAVGRTGWLDEPDGRRWYTVWDPEGFAAVVADAGFTVEDVDRGVFVEVWATRNG